MILKQPITILSPTRCVEFVPFEDDFHSSAGTIQQDNNCYLQLVAKLLSSEGLQPVSWSPTMNSKRAPVPMINKAHKHQMSIVVLLKYRACRWSADLAAGFIPSFRN